MATAEWIDSVNLNDDLSAGIKEYKFYDGTETLFYDDPAHEYFKYEKGTGNRISIPGCTTILQIIDKSHALVPWAVKLATTHLQSKFFNADNSLASFTAEDVVAWLDEARNKHREKLEEAGDIGHMAHSGLELTIQKAIDQTDGYVKALVGIPENPLSLNCYNAAIEWMRAHNVQWIYTERKIYSREYNFAGTCDGVAYVDSCDDLRCCRGKHFKRRLAVIDWKTSNSLRDSYDLQAAAYAFALVEELAMPISHRFILRLGKTDGAFEPRMLTPEQFAGDFETFLSAKNLSQDIKQLAERNRKDNAELKALIKAERDREKAAAKQAEKDAKAAIKAQQKAEREAQKQAEKDAKAAAKKTKQEPASAEVLAPDVRKVPQISDSRETMWAAMSSFSIGQDGKIKEAEPETVEVRAAAVEKNINTDALAMDVGRTHAYMAAMRALRNERIDLAAATHEEPDCNPDVVYTMTSQVSVYHSESGTHIFTRSI